MKQIYPAAVSERIGATLLNLFVGVSPVVIPLLLYYTPATESWSKSECYTDLFSLVLAFIQLILFYRLGGSPGFVCSGLRIQLLSGEPLAIKSAAIRSAPYMTAFLILLALPRSGEHSVITGVLGVLLLAVMGLLLINGVILMLDGKRSIIDRLSGTTVVKAYSIFS